MKKHFYDVNGKRKEEAKGAAGFRGWKENDYSLFEKRVISMEVEGSPDTADLNYYHADCTCKESVMFEPEENRKPCQYCGTVLNLTNRVKYSEDDCLMHEAMYWGRV